MVSFRKCEICGRPLEGPEAEQHEVEHRRLDTAAGAVLEHGVPRDLPSAAICDACLRAYRKGIGQAHPPETPPD